MRIDEASKILADMCNKAGEGEMSTMVRLFGIKYADQIGDMPIRDLDKVADGANLSKNYGTEIRKGINLAKYVEVKEQYR